MKIMITNNINVNKELKFKEEKIMEYNWGSCKNN